LALFDSEAKARDILKSSGLWRDRKTRPPPKTISSPQKPVKYPLLEQVPKAEDFGDYTCGEFIEPVPDYETCDMVSKSNH